MFNLLVTAVLLVAGAYGLAGADPLNGGDDDAVCVRIEALIEDSIWLELPPRIERAFTLTLNAAGAAAHERQNATALTLLKTFTSEVRGVARAKRIQEDAARALIARAEETIAALSRTNRARGQP